MLPEAIIYTDGSAGADKRGGWSAIVATPSFGIEITGCELNTTNNRMEIIAALEGMKILKEPHDIKLVSDSAYMLNTIKSKWYTRWFDEAERVPQHKGNPRPNLDLWRAMVELLCYHVVTTVKVKGHAGVEHNERVDKLAVAARKQQTTSLEVLYGNYYYAS